MKQLTADQIQLLTATSHLSVAESGSICNQTQDTVRTWRRQQGIERPKTADHTRFTIRPGEHVLHAYQSGKLGYDVVGKVLATKGRKCLVEWEHGTTWHPLNQLAAYPTLDEIQLRAYKIKMRNIERMAALG